MIDIERLYNDRFFRGRSKYHWRAPIVCSVVQWLFRKVPLRRVVDVGAATGDLVKGFADLGLEAWGIEGSGGCLPYVVCDLERFIVHDLRQPIEPVVSQIWPERHRFDLVTCFEVAEHIDPERAGVFVANLCYLSPRLLISACPPSTRMGHSGSVGHVNEQEPAYWEAQFGALGYVRPRKLKWPADGMIRTKLEWRFRACLFPWRSKFGIKAYYENVLYFEKRRKK